MLRSDRMKHSKNSGRPTLKSTTSSIRSATYKAAKWPRPERASQIKFDGVIKSDDDTARAQIVASGGWVECTPQHRS